MSGKYICTLCLFTASVFAAAQEEAKILPVQPDAKRFTVRRGLAEIICAEISRTKPEITGENTQDVSPFGQNTAWGQLILSLPEGRGFSRFDFAIEWNGTTCPGMAVAAEDTPYSMQKDTWRIAKLQKPGQIRVLFAMPGNIMNEASPVGPLLLVRKIGQKTSIPADQFYMKTVENFTTAAGAVASMTEKAENAVPETPAPEPEKNVTPEQEKPVELPAEPPKAPEVPAAPAAPAAPVAPVAPAVPAAPAKTEIPAAPAAPALQLNFSL